MLRFALAIVGVVTACSPASLPLAAEVNSFSLHELGNHLAQPIPAATMKIYNNIPVMAYYKALLDSTSDASFTIGGQQMRGVHARLVAAEPAFAALAAKYPSWGSQAAKRANLTVIPGRSKQADHYKSLASAYNGGKGAFAHLAMMLTAVHAQNSSAAHVTAAAKPKTKVLLKSQPTALRNLAAISALAVVGNHAGVSLGLVTNAYGNGECFDTAAAAIPSVAELQFNKADGADHSCTGTFFKGDDQYDYMLTAGHCVAGASNWTTRNEAGQSVSGTAQHKGEYSEQSFSTPQSMDSTTQHDVGIISFPSGTAAAYTSVATSGAQVGEPVGVIGYGNTSVVKGAADDYGNLSCGANAVSAASSQQGTIQLSGFAGTTTDEADPGSSSLPASGDSGGPLVVLRNGKAQIAGVVSNGNDGDDANSVATANYADTSTQSNQQFVSNATNSEHACSDTVCGQ